MYIIKVKNLPEPCFATVFATRRAALQYIKRCLVTDGIFTFNTAHLTDDNMELTLRAAVDAYNYKTAEAADDIEFHIRGVHFQTASAEETPEKEDSETSKPNDMISYSSSPVNRSVSSDSSSSSSSSSSSTEPSVQVIRSLGKRPRPTTGQLTVKREHR